MKRENKNEVHYQQSWHFVHNIHNSWNHSLATSALTFDIKGYFKFVTHKHLLNEMKKYHIPLKLVKWTAIYLDGTWGEIKPVKKGIP